MSKIKITIYLVIGLVSLLCYGEPYRPYPVIFVHGYNANNVSGNSFGMSMKSSFYSPDIAHPIEASPYAAPKTGE